ncbi:hypothetical protein C8J23_1414 [Shewanella chilikensis]|uniref:Uncharacterized protein n=1 Tax=Shewanella chilikensis TaxID=558541 RepID=A0ABX5PIR7_9GAMM|nr:hypothetical protein C8J23_1414 [Shewanella chilikensis]
MTTARRQLIDAESTPFYHVINSYVLGGPSVNNCQTYADSVRRQIEVTYGSKE